MSEHPSDCRFCEAGEPMEHNYEPPNGYTDEPTHLRIYREETGDEYVWHLDGADDEGNYTEDVRTFATRAECVMYADLFVRDTETDGVVWKWNTTRPRHGIKKQYVPCPTCGGSGEVTKAGSVEVNEFGVWDRDTAPCPTCTT